MPTRVLLAKPGLDGHDRGVKVIARACRDAGFEVIYTGIRQSAAAIAETAVQEDVDVVGLSVLSGAHMIVTRDVVRKLHARGGADIPIIVGGTIPERDEARLLAEGASVVFGVSSPHEAIVDYIRSLRATGEARGGPAERQDTSSGSHAGRHADAHRRQHEGAPAGARAKDKGDSRP